MGTHSVAEAKNKLPELIDRALAGEGVVIERDGQPVAELRAITTPAPELPPRPVTKADMDWLRERRIGRGRMPSEDAATLVSRMRDEGEK